MFVTSALMESFDVSESAVNEVYTVIVYVPNSETSTVWVNVYSIELLPSSGPATVSVTVSPLNS